MALPDPEPAAAVEPGWSVSVVIPHHAGRDRLRSCLQSVVDQEYPQLEILVVDSGSTDHSTEGLEREFPRARVERLPSNAGFAAAANLGVGRATGELIAMVNDDVRLERGWIESMVRALRSGLRHASAAAKVLREDDPRRLDSAGIGLTRLGYTFNLGAGLPADEGFDEPREVFGASAAAAMYRRRVFDQIGWFDELFESYLEDVDLSLRAQLHGYSCIYVPDAVAYHAGASTSGGQYSPYMVEHVARNTLFLLLKSMPRAVLEQNLVRIGLLQVASQSFHLLFTRRGRSHYRGLREGLARNSDIIPIRRRVLGARRVDDPPIIALLQQCERDLATLDGLGWKRRALRLLHG